MTTLRIADDLELPIDLVVQKIAILARSGAGKTNTAVDVVEELLEAKQQVVILDPPGAWWGLRTSADGKQPGYPVVVLGGVHGDLPLESTSGELVADLVVDQGLSMVLDLSEFTDGEMYRFVEAFARRLYARKNTVRDPMLVVFEEADEMAPQTVRPNQAQLVHAMERIAKRGRMRGIGFLAISQRTASLNWNVLSQAEVLIAHQTTAELDIKAIDDWIKRTGDQEKRRQVLAELAHLPVGTAYLWSPGWLRLFRKVHFRRRRTFDSSATPAPGKRVVQPRTRADVDLEQLRTRMASTIEKAKAEDPRELRRRVIELERQLSTKPAAAPPVHIETTIEVVPEAVVMLLRALERNIGRTVEELSAYHHNLREGIEMLPQARKVPRPAERERTPVPRIAPVPVEHRRPPPHSPAPRPEQEAAAAPIKAGARRMVQVLARFHPRSLSRPQLGTLAEVARGGTFTDYLRSVVQSGLVSELASGELAVTLAGLQFIGSAPGQPMGTDEILDIWRPKLKAGARRMLELLADAYPDGLSRADLGQQADVARGGTFTDYLRSLTRNGLAEERDGEIRAAETLFLALSA